MGTIFSNLIDLISLNKGVAWGENICHESHFCLRFYIYDSKTRLLVHYVAEASNTSLNIFAKRQPGELDREADADGELVYEYSSTSGSDALDQACWLGAHLTWAMYKAQVINSEMEKKFCTVFGAVSRSP